MMGILTAITAISITGMWAYVVLKVAQFIGKDDDDDTDHLA